MTRGATSNTILAAVQRLEGVYIERSKHVDRRLDNIEEGAKEAKRAAQKAHEVLAAEIGSLRSEQAKATKFIDNCNFGRRLVMWSFTAVAGIATFALAVAEKARVASWFKP